MGVTLQAGVGVTLQAGVGVTQQQQPVGVGVYHPSANTIAMYDGKIKH